MTLLVALMLTGAISLPLRANAAEDQRDGQGAATDSELQTNGKATATDAKAKQPPMESPQDSNDSDVKAKDSPRQAGPHPPHG
ncbi:MAG: hypothetical protein AAF648_02145 [Pseudomonadota bacterium]